MSGLIGKDRPKHKMRPRSAGLALQRIQRELLEIVERAPDSAAQERTRREVEWTIRTIGRLYEAESLAQPMTGAACVILE